ncbi:hypothetical protein BDR04DRAFT_1116984 [Suillus decipiens]|nr:hypothetical protein BDR04DRAFT_1116984 [Suillus decipiens]
MESKHMANLGIQAEFKCYACPLTTTLSLFCVITGFTDALHKGPKGHGTTLGAHYLWKRQKQLQSEGDCPSGKDKVSKKYCECHDKLHATGTGVMPQDEGSVQNLHVQILKEFPWYDDLLSVMGGILPCLSEQSHRVQAALTLTLCALGALNLAVSHTLLLVSLILLPLVVVSHVLPPLVVSHILLPLVVSFILPPLAVSLTIPPLVVSLTLLSLVHGVALTTNISSLLGFFAVQGHISVISSHVDINDVTSQFIIHRKTAEEESDKITWEELKNECYLVKYKLAQQVNEHKFLKHECIDDYAEAAAVHIRGLEAKNSEIHLHEAEAKMHDALVHVHKEEETTLHLKIE